MTRKRYTSEQIIHKLREAEVELAPAARSTATTAVFSFDMAAKYRGVRLYYPVPPRPPQHQGKRSTPSTAAARKYSYVFTPRNSVPLVRSAAVWLARPGTPPKEGRVCTS